jgi:ribosome-binding ATPase
MNIRFPTMLVLNKIDLANAESNIAKLYKRYGEDSIVLSSALAEIFLRNMHTHKFIHYQPGEDDFVTADAAFDEDDDEQNAERQAIRASLKPLDDRNRKRLRKLRDMVLYRYGGTGAGVG